ncbi:hypothetical protein [Parafrankia discariae]|uniref:hypothetical protein n=1 Tax=Parafrankia discariae TaxID=365528 RepID=UPI00035E5189|nr:hypothetical protein [Parafrankia discariae]
MPQITLSLSVEETNLVLEALGQLPYARVFRLIENIGEQAQPQLESPEPTAESGRPRVRSA